MNRFFYAFLLILFSSTLLAQSNGQLVNINGVEEEVANNIEKRLAELNQVKPIAEINQEELKVQIQRSLQPFGYFKPQILVHVSNNKPISLWIQPGPRMLITQCIIDIQGEGKNNPVLIKAKNQISLKDGDPLNAKSYTQAKQTLTDAAENQGYLHAHFIKAELVIDTEHNQAEIGLILETGPQFYFGQVRFNPTTIDESLIKRYLPFQKGQAYSTDKLLQLNNNLSLSGYFNSVDIKPQIQDNYEVPITLQLHPQPKYSYTLSAGYGTDTGPRGRAGLSIIPVNKWGHKFSALAQGSFTQNALQAQYIVPGMNPVTDYYALTGNFSNLNYTSGYSNALLLSLAQQHHLEHYQRTLSLNNL